MPYGDVLDAETERIASIIVDSIFAVHKELGPGLLESIYVECLVIELRSRGLKVEREVYFIFDYKGHEVQTRVRVDLLVEDRIIVEAKAVQAMDKIFHVITRTYLKVAKKRLGILVNFNVTLIKDGITRIIL